MIIIIIFIVNWTLRKKLQSNCIHNSNIFIQETAFENVVWKMSAILSRPQYVKSLQCCFRYRVITPLACMRYVPRIMHSTRILIGFVVVWYGRFIIVTSQWSPRRLKSPAYRLFNQPFVQAHIKENVKAPHHRPLWGGDPPTTGGFPDHKGPVTRKMFPFDDIIMFTHNLGNMEPAKLPSPRVIIRGSCPHFPNDPSLVRVLPAVALSVQSTHCSRQPLMPPFVNYD